MTLAEQIYQYLLVSGPKTDAEISVHLEAKLPSVRRARNTDKRILADSRVSAVTNKMNLWRIRTDADPVFVAPLAAPAPEPVLGSVGAGLKSAKEFRLEQIRESASRLAEHE